MCRVLFLANALVLLLSVPSFAAQQLRYDREYPAVGYSAAPTDRVADLQRALASGAADLTFADKGGYLTSLLASLDIPAASQMLVFSKTSFQERFVSPETPRAVYFSDDVYVAWLEGSEFLEIATMDPRMGPVFYTLSQERAASPVLKRETGLCLQCHDTYGLSGGGVPRFLIGSGATNELGRPATHNAWQLTTDQTPLAERWGGWYVTGSHGKQVHMGNLVLDVLAGETSGGAAAADTSGTAAAASGTADATSGTASAASGATSSNGNLTDLTGLVDTAPYLTGHSDIVALMVIEHQIRVQNVMTRANWEVRSAAEAGPDPGDSPASPDIAQLAEPLVQAMLFVDEAHLAGPIEGTSGFRTHFEAMGPSDDQGRSLRELDLDRRLFRYPLSYLIYSDAFGGLPDPLKERVF